MNSLPLKNAFRQPRTGLLLMTSLAVGSAIQTHLQAAYEYPIGIPKAWIEPDVASPARPSPWTDEIPGYFYVDYAVGKDTGRSYGHPGSPRKTIPTPIPAGSRVEVNGLYSASTGSLFIAFAGSDGEWVANTSGPGWLTGSSDANRTSFTGTVYLVGQYGCVEFVNNFGSNKPIRFNSTTNGAGRKANHFLLRNSEFKGTNSATDSGGVDINGNKDVGGMGQHIIFYHNEVHHFGLTDPDGSDPDFIAVFVSDNCNKIWILDNSLHDMSGSAVQCTANTGSAPTTSHVYAGRNECYNLWGTGMASKSAQNIVYSENHIHDIKDNAGKSPSKGIAGQYGATDQWLLFNRIHNCAHGILRVSGNVGSEERLYAIGNIIYDIAPLDGEFSASGYGEAAIGLWGADKNYIIGNVMYNVPQGVATPALALLYVENNIIANLNQPAGMHILASAAGAINDGRFNNNLFFQDGGTIRIKLPAKQLMNVAALNTSSFGSGNLTGNPLFGNPAGYDFSIHTNSPAKDAGRAPTALATDVYTLYFNTFGVSIERDVNSVARPVGPAWDIGAYEAHPPPKPFGYNVKPLAN